MPALYFVTYRRLCDGLTYEVDFFGTLSSVRSEAEEEAKTFRGLEAITIVSVKRARKQPKV